MRRRHVALCLLGCVALTGCLGQRKRPYDNAPVLLHYKPTLSDSATILAEKQARRGPVKPPMPVLARDDEREQPGMSSPKYDQILPAKTENTDQPLAPPPVEPLSSHSSRKNGPVMRASSLPSSSLPVRPSHVAPEPPPLPPLPPPPTVAVPLALELPRMPEAEQLPAPLPAAETVSISIVEVPDAVITIDGEPQVRFALMAAPTPVATAKRRERRTVAGDYGRSEDYRWLQGVLERHHRGYFSIRFCDPSVEDELGGKVRLQDDVRIAGFGDGDVIAVEGELLKHEANPLFAVHDLWLVRSKH